MIDGPKLLQTPDTDWEGHLAKENIHAWYHTPKLYALLQKFHLGFLAIMAAPRGYSRMDQDGVPDSDDMIMVKASILALAIEYVRAVDAKLRPSQKQIDGAYVIGHEFFHCKVPWEGTVPAVTYKALAEAYSHPGTAVEGLKHAVRVRAAVNAFTGLLRWRKAPAAGFEEFMTWMRLQAQQRATP